MVSRTAPCQKAMRYHLPVLERCWLICSVQTLNIAQALRQEFPQVCVVDPIIINDVNDPIEFRDRVNEIYSQLPEGWNESDIIADYLGMTAHGSIGMVLACLSALRPLQYTPARLDEQQRPLEPLDPIEITLDWESVGVKPVMLEERTS